MCLYVCVCVCVHLCPCAVCGRVSRPSAKDPWKTLVDTDGTVEVPLSKLSQLPVSSSLLYNEFIVYNVNQIRIKYLVLARFNYK